MSDSVTKYYENMAEKDEMFGLDKSPDERRSDQILELLAKATKANKIVQVQTRAAEVQKEYNSASLLLGLQIACDEIL